MQASAQLSVVYYISQEATCLQEGTSKQHQGMDSEDVLDQLYGQHPRVLDWTGYRRSPGIPLLESSVADHHEAKSASLLKDVSNEESIQPRNSCRYR